MKLLAITLLQAQAGAAAGQSAAGSSMSFWIMIILMFVIMWLFMIRPQRKQQKEMENFRKNLKRGDKVVTAGGIYGTVDEIKENTLLIKVDGDVKLRVAKTSVQKDFTEDAAAQAPQK